MRAATAAVAATLVALALPAGAGEVPTPVLTASGGSQQGAFMTATETGRQDRAICWMSVADGVENYPDPVRHDASQGLRIHLARPDRPTAVSVYVDRNPTALPLSLESESSYTLRPVTVRGRTTGWDVLLPPPDRGDLRLRVHAEWRGECGASDAGSWGFRVLSL